MDLVERFLQKVGSVDGEMTVVTKAGENVTITITKGPSTESEADINKEAQPKDTEVTKEPTSSAELASVLPTLESIEDVFKVLGVWEDAHMLHNKGLSWSHVARELGYSKDTMYAKLQNIAEERLKSAKESGLITHELLEKKLAYFSEIALKWVHKIFADIDKSTIDLASILPTLESIEDVFKVLGVWEDAHMLHNKGLSWSHVARELGYSKDTMYAKLQNIAEERLKSAKESGLITHELLEKKLAYFSEIALKWVHKIFADTDEEEKVTVEEETKKFEGTIKAIDGDIWKVVDEGEIWIVNVSEAEIIREPAVGLRAFIVGVKKDNVVIALEIEIEVVEKEDKIHDFYGIIKSINGDIWKVSVEGDIRVVDVSEASIRAEPEIGLKVVVAGTVKDNIIKALEIDEAE